MENEKFSSDRSIAEIHLFTNEKEKRNGETGGKNAAVETTEEKISFWNSKEDANFDSARKIKKAD